jgi:hypothetical protein
LVVVNNLRTFNISRKDNSMRRIQAPGIEINEIDKSTYND